MRCVGGDERRREKVEGEEEGKRIREGEAKG